MRLIDADKLYPDCLTKRGTLAISQSQIANAPTVDTTLAICGGCKYADVPRNRKPCCSCSWLERKSYYEEAEE